MTVNSPKPENDPKKSPKPKVIKRKLRKTRKIKLRASKTTKANKLIDNPVKVRLMNQSLRKRIVKGKLYPI